MILHPEDFKSTLQHYEMYSLSIEHTTQGEYRVGGAERLRPLTEPYVRITYTASHANFTRIL